MPQLFCGLERTDMTTITVSTPARVVAPRGALIAATWFAALLKGLEVVGSQRQARIAQADRLAETARVRVYAQEVRLHDPRFAADLLAAADRHERG
jgi:hypothetical protein